MRRATAEKFASFNYSIMHALEERRESRTVLRPRRFQLDDAVFLTLNARNARDKKRLVLTTISVVMDHADSISKNFL